MMLKNQDIALGRGKRAVNARQRMMARIDEKMPDCMAYPKSERTDPDTMIVTLTRSDLARLVSSVVEESVSKAILGLEDRIAASINADTLCGSQAISDFLGISRDTFYNELSKGTFGNSVKHIGRKVIASRSGLMKALSIIE